MVVSHVVSPATYAGRMAISRCHRGMQAGVSPNCERRTCRRKAGIFVPRAKRDGRDADVELITELEVIEPEVERDAEQALLSVGAAVLFGAGVWAVLGPSKGEQYFAGYLLEQSLSIDNLFVFVLVFSQFQTPVPSQKVVLSYGIATAAVLRLVLILLCEMMQRLAALETSRPALLRKAMNLQDHTRDHAAAVPATPSSLPHGTASAFATQSAFETAVRLCEEHGKSDSSLQLSADVPRLLRRVFADDFERAIHSAKSVKNVTCMRPADGVDGARLFEDELLELPLRPGRACQGGCCSRACSRALFFELATHDECNDFVQQVQSLMPPGDERPHTNMYLAACAAAGSARTMLTYLRLVERMRRVIAHEYGLQLECIAPRQTFVSRIQGTSERLSQSLHVSKIPRSAGVSETACTQGTGVPDPTSSPLPRLARSVHIHRD